MSGDGSVDIGGPAIGSVINTGKGATIDATVTVTNNQNTATRDDAAAAIAEIRKLLELMQHEDQKVSRAMADATDEVAKAQPDKDEVGGLLDRALKLGKRTAAFGSATQALLPYVKTAVAWLGGTWSKLIGYVTG